MRMGFAGCGDAEHDSFQGYVEGEYVYLAAPQAGYLQTLDAPRGSRVKSGQTVFVITDAPDAQWLQEAEAHAESAKQKLINLQEPRRPTEIASLEANLRAAEAGLNLAEIQLRQQQTLVRQHFVAQIKVDEAASVHRQAAAAVQAIKKQIATYRNTLGRQAEVRGAEMDVQVANAELAAKQWLLAHKTGLAPAPGEINDTYYQPGEWVPAGAPVASLLPDARRKLRFFVPETAVASMKPGDSIEARCDGCAAAIRAHINYVAAQAEYTPPVIYSRGSREKLVFRIEALPAPEQAAQLRPGLPVDVRLVQAHEQ